MLTNPSISSSSPRAPGATNASVSRRSASAGEPAQPARAARKVLRRWPNAASMTAKTSARVAVVGTPAPVIGEIGVAFVVPDAAGPVTAAELKRWCLTRIADYKVPDTVILVDDLPVNATFKVDTGQLKKMAAARQNV